MKKAKSGTKSQVARKVRRGRPAVNDVRALVVDGIGTVPPDAVLQDAALRSYLSLGSFQATADALGLSVGKTHQLVTAATAHLREASSPAHRSAVLALVEGRVNGLWQTVSGAISLCTASGQVEKIAALAAVGGRLCELLARFHGVGADAAAPAVVDLGRVEEVQRRILLAGPHSQAGRLAARSAMNMAGVKEADARDVSPEGVKP